MIGPDLLARVTAEAVVPEQVVQYVRAAAGSKPAMLGRCVGFLSESDLVLIGYPVGDPLDIQAMSESVDHALRMPGISRVTVVGPTRPSQVPPHIQASEDSYCSLPLPAPPPGQKLRNLLRRAARDLSLHEGHRLEEDHLELVSRFIAARPLAAGTRHILERIPAYLAASPSSLVLSGRLSNGGLAAFAVGEFGSLATAFFMFCFRDPGLAPPGSSDLLLSGLLAEAARRGQTLMNLGLGINEGIRFFKAKWGAMPFLPYVQVSWEPRTPGLLSRMRAVLSGRREGSKA